MNASNVLLSCLLVCALLVPTEWLWSEEQRPNVLLICVDDLRPELACYGATHVQSPAIDALASQGVLFARHYVQAPTCGASRFALLTGNYGPAGNGALFQRAKQMTAGRTISPSMPAWFRENGYQTTSIGKVSHHPGGLGGADWDDPEQVELPEAWVNRHAPAGPWQHPRGWMHGLANGQIRTNPGQMEILQATQGDDSIYPDGLVTSAAIQSIQDWDRDTPQFLAVGFLRPHLPFGAPEKYLQLYRDTELPDIAWPTKPTGRTTWHRSGEFMKYQRWGLDPRQDGEFADRVRRHYLACVSYVDTQIGLLIQELKKSEQDQNTIIVLWGDHGWHLGEHAIWGKHSLFEESLHSPLIVVDPRRSESAVVVDEVVETIDLFPTLCELSGLTIPEGLDGQTLTALSNSQTKDRLDPMAVSYHGTACTIRDGDFRLIHHNDGFVELYDHRQAARETENVVEQNSDVVQRLTEKLFTALPDRRPK